MDIPFSSVLGHETVRRHLWGAVLADSVSHAYIFEGNPGVGRHSMAYALAETLMCTENRDALGGIRACGCGNCVACRTVRDGNHPDVRVIGLLKDKKEITVKQIREELVAEMAIRPYYGGRKIFIVENAEAMNPAAQNALLKTLEEPPAYGVIILITTSAAALLSTVESRSVKIGFQPLPEDTIRAELIRRGFPAETVALGTTFSGGSLGQALAACADESFTDMRRDIYALLSEAPGKSAGWLLGQEKSLETYKANAQNLLSLMETWFRDVLVLKQTGDRTALLSADYADALARAARVYSSAQLARVIWQIRDVGEKLSQNGNYALSMDNLLLALETSE